MPRDHDDIDDADDVRSDDVRADYRDYPPARPRKKGGPGLYVSLLVAAAILTLVVVCAGVVTLLALRIEPQPPVKQAPAATSIDEQPVPAGPMDKGKGKK